MPTIPSPSFRRLSSRVAFAVIGAAALLASAGVSLRAPIAKGDPTTVFEESVVVRGCEMWIDKAVAEAVATHPDLGTIWHSRLYVKVDTRAIPLETIARVGWLGRERTFRGGRLTNATEWQERELMPFEPNSRDYFVLDLGNLSTQYPSLRDPQPFRLEHEGVFFVETIEGRRFWLNENRTSYDNWAFDLGLEKYLKKERQTLGSVGLGALASLSEARRTADFSPWLNPGGCR